MVEEILEGTKPTRMELLAVRRKKSLAEKGHKLLTEKRDALITEFFELIRERNKLRKALNARIDDAYRVLTQTEMTLGPSRTMTLAQGLPDVGEITADKRSIMGVAVPQIKFDPATAMTPSYSFAETNAKFDEATERLRRALAMTLKVGEHESAIRRLGFEIEKTKRRVNALEYIFIPKLGATVKYIEMQLEEREREDFFRRKRIKALMSK